MDQPLPDLPDHLSEHPLQVSGPLPGLSWDPPVRPKPRQRRWVHVLLLIGTLITTTAVGGLHYASWALDPAAADPGLPTAALMVRGLWYSLSVLAILGAHEMGHYLMCIRYGVDASLPYFLPAPFLTGTLGAFIRIREPITTKRALFDIGIAGPVAGFVVAVPVLWFGLRLSHVMTIPDDWQGLELGEPLLFRALAWLQYGSLPEGETLNLHPMAFAAWFGLLATALNLIPIGQLDGGHIAYAALGRRSTPLTFAMLAMLVGLSFVSSSWIVWTVMALAMVWRFGAKHPPTWDAHEPLDPGRRRWALVALAMLLVCFTPAPIEVTDLVQPDPEHHDSREHLLEARSRRGDVPLARATAPSSGLHPRSPGV